MSRGVNRLERRDLPRHAAIIGAGTMGLGVAECFALAGLDVLLVDETPVASQMALERLSQRVLTHVGSGLAAAGCFRVGE